MNKPIVRWLLVGLGGAALALCLASAGLCAYLLHRYGPVLNDLLHARLDLKKQITASVDSRFPVDISLDHRFDFRLRKDIPVEIPIQALLQVPLDETLLVPVTDSFVVEMNGPLFIDEQIRVRSEVPLDMSVQTRIMGMDLSLPIRGTVPIDITFPLKQEVGVRRAFSLRIADPLPVRVRQVMQVPVSFVLRAVLPVDEEITVPLHTVMEGRIAIPEPLPCTVEMNVSARDWGGAIRITR